MGRLNPLPFWLMWASVMNLAMFHQPARADGITLAWADNYLTLHSDELPTGQLKIHYLEAYCRANSQTTDWVDHTVIGHRTRLRTANRDGKQLELECRLNDGVTVEHRITASDDEVDFRIIAHNPTATNSQAHWAQPCIRVGEFTGLGADQTDDAYAYIAKSFIFLDGQLTRMPTPDWASAARYTPGQVWAAPGVPAEDVNPRPLNPHRPRPGLIGCFRGDDARILAVAFEPYQELFQGVIRCLHSDFRFGGIPAGQRREVHGKLYLLPNDIPALLERYERDFSSANSAPREP